MAAQFAAQAGPVLQAEAEVDAVALDDVAVLVADGHRYARGVLAVGGQFGGKGVCEGVTDGRGPGPRPRSLGVLGQGLGEGAALADAGVVVGEVAEELLDVVLVPVL